MPANITANFTYAELTASDTALRLGIDNTPDDEELRYLTRLCLEILQPLRDRIHPLTGGGVQITSGYRCIALNRHIGSSDTSHHVQGRAADIKAPGKTPLEVCRLIVSMELPFEQLIMEGNWTHVSIPLDGRAPKRQCLSAHFAANGSVTYTLGFPH